MPHLALFVYVGVPSAIALLLLCVTLIRNEKSQWTLTSSTVFAVGWLLGAPVAAATLFDQVALLSGGSLDRVHRVYTSQWYEVLSHVRNYLLLALAVVVIVCRLRPRTKLSGATVLMLAAVALASLADLGSGGALLDSSRLILLGLILTGGLLKPKGAALGAATFGLSFAILSALAVLLNFDVATRPCGTNKCGPLGLLLLGLVENENLLGLTLAASIPFVLLAFRGVRIRWSMAIYLTVIVWFTGSRTALIAAIVATIAIALSKEWSRRGSLARSWLAFVSISGISIGLILPFVVVNPKGFTGRANLWLAAREFLEGHWLTGLGGQFWVHLQQSSIINSASIYSVHNQWLDVMFDAGILGLIAFAAALFLIARQPSGLLVLIPVVWVGITERLISISRADSFAWLLPAILLVASEYQWRGPASDQPAAIVAKSPSDESLKFAETPNPSVIGSA